MFFKVITIVMAAFTILQWNCHGIWAHGNELKAHLMDLTQLPHIICLQETFTSETRPDFKIPGYQKPLRKNRNNEYGGVAIYILNKINFTKNTVAPNIECLSVKIYIKNTYYNVTNFYQYGEDFAALNDIEILFNLDRHIVCGDFNAHSLLWCHTGTDRVL